MADRITQEQRSRVMAAVRGRGNKSTERRLRAHLVRAGIRGWTLHQRGLPGTPDFVFARVRLAVFVDGCYWHCCPRCGTRPSSNTTYWEAKLEANRRRDRRNTLALRSAGWRVLRFWEHEVQESPAKVIRRITAVLLKGRRKTALR